VSSQKSPQRESDFFHDLFLELHSVRGVCGCSRRLGSCFGIDLLLFFGDHQTPKLDPLSPILCWHNGCAWIFKLHNDLIYCTHSYYDGQEKEAGGTERKFRFAYKRGGEKDPLMTFHFMSGVFSSLAHSRPF